MAKSRCSTMKYLAHCGQEEVELQHEGCSLDAVCAVSVPLMNIFSRTQSISSVSIGTFTGEISQWGTDLRMLWKQNMQPKWSKGKERKKLSVTRGGHTRGGDPGWRSSAQSYTRGRTREVLQGLSGEEWADTATLPERIYSYSWGVNQWKWAWCSWAMIARRRTPLRKTKGCSWILWIKKDGKILVGVQSECEAEHGCCRVQGWTVGHSGGIRRAYRNWTGGGEG